MDPKSIKSMKGTKAMEAVQVFTKTGLVDAFAAATELNKSECAKVLKVLAEVVANEVKTKGKVIIPGVVKIKAHIKPATMAGKREMFGKSMLVAAKQAKTVVKAYPAAAIKTAILSSASSDCPLDSEESLCEQSDGPDSEF